MARRHAHPVESAAPGPTQHTQSRLIVVSNRLPVVALGSQDGFRAGRASGGLVSALQPALQRRAVTWIGWSGAAAERIPAQDEAKLLAGCRAELGCELRPVRLREGEIEGFYSGFSNRVLWPLFHGLWAKCEFEADYFAAYQQVNELFAQEVARCAGSGDFVWVHDYHLLMVGQAVRRRGVATPRLGFFLHIPFPEADTLAKLPWRRELVAALLAYDTVGFQTAFDQRNFLEAVRELFPRAMIADEGAQPARVELEGRELRVATLPIGVDFDGIAADAASAAVSRRVSQLRSRLRARHVLLGVDRLDYTKGLPERLEAFASLLESRPEYRGEVVLIQVVVPSRESIPEYARVKREVDRLVGRINGQYSTPSWIPIHHQYGSVSRAELLALYRLATLMLVTSVKDGMNVVSKEYCAATVDDDGALVLSEFAGAALQLREGALLVNPFDRESMVEAMHAACTMSRRDRIARMRALRHAVARDDVRRWADKCLATNGHAPVRAAACASARPAEALAALSAGWRALSAGEDPVR